MLDHEHACTLTRLDQAFGRQLRQRFADDRAADAERLRQLSFGRQFLTGMDLACLQLPADGRDHAL